MARRDGRDLLTRLLDNVETGNHTDCWIWMGARNNIGYGMIRDENKMRTTHRVSYEEHTGSKIPTGMCVCHSCDNPGCVNPSHLWIGTRKQRAEDMIRKGRHKFWGGKTRLGAKNPRTICPHCNRDIANNVYLRWHGDKCKQKTTE